MNCHNEQLLSALPLFVLTSAEWVLLPLNSATWRKLRRLTCMESTCTLCLWVHCGASSPVSIQTQSLALRVLRKRKPQETQALAFLAVFIYATHATHATQAIAFEWKPGFRLQLGLYTRILRSVEWPDRRLLSQCSFSYLAAACSLQYNFVVFASIYVDYIYINAIGNNHGIVILMQTRCVRKNYRQIFTKVM